MTEAERVYWRQRIFHFYNPSMQATVAENPGWCYCNDKLLTLKRFREQLGAEAVNAWLCLQLNHTAKSWGSADGLTSEQLQAAAAAITVAYGELNLGEVMLYLCYLLAGRYGKVAFGALTVDAMVSNLPEFMKERNRERGRYERLLEDAARAREAAEHAKHCCTRERYLELRAQALQRTNGNEQAARELLKRRFWLEEEEKE